MNFLMSSAVAQESSKAMAQPHPVMQFVPFVLVFFIFYFLMIKPQKKKLQAEQDLLSKLDRGDEVFTKSGILGTIIGLNEKIVTLEVAEGVKMKILRGQIGGLSKSIFESAKKDATKKEIAKK